MTQSPNHPITHSAPAKVILFGEHAVVYGRPAIAVPVTAVWASARIQPSSAGTGCTLVARDLDETVALATAPADHPLALITRLALDELGLPPDPDWRIEVWSAIPVASGLGSGAAISTALVRAIFAQAGQPAHPEAVSRLVYRSEELHHGTPSGIDNTVIAYEQPVWFVRGEPIQTFTLAHALPLVIADSGIPSPTKETVGDVRRAREADPHTYEAIFDEIGEIVTEARTALEEGNLARLGPLMARNQQRLAQIGVSSPELERLIQAALAAGAMGAKLSGGGRGGNVIALVTPQSRGAVVEALRQAGARRVVSGG
jgi:mevalonate kinase